MKTYICRPGQTTIGPVTVMVQDSDGGLRPLDPRRDLRNHSPDGFGCGYAGSGPAQLALALCADALGDDQMAVLAYQKVKFAYVACQKAEKGFRVTDKEIRNLCYRIGVLPKERA